MSLSNKALVAVINAALPENNPARDIDPVSHSSGVIFKWRSSTFIVYKDLDVLEVLAAREVYGQLDLLTRESDSSQLMSLLFKAVYNPEPLCVNSSGSDWEQ